jgi:hypothetical protein
LLGDSKLKEYKVETVDSKVYSNPKHAKEFEKILNDQAVEGWELKLVASFFLVFEREKS